MLYVDLAFGLTGSKLPVDYGYWVHLAKDRFMQ